ncbi:MAG: PDZ domain-containing protein, partial [Pirellulales bacterium]|nr:PDZ domain-containing protein [Pirellulales bacterium]
NVETAIPLKFTWRTKANSDHYPIFEQGLPYLLFHTGLHEDYHRPSDDANKVNVAGLERCSRLIFLTLHELANADRLATFRDASQYEALYAEQTHEAPLPPVPSRLGVWWNVDDPEGGLLIKRVDYGTAAEEAGLQAGDRIVQFNEQEIERGDADAAERFRAAVMRTPNRFPLRVVRQGEEKPIELTPSLRGKPVRIGIAWRSDAAEPGVATIVRIVPGTPAANAELQLADRIYSAGGQRLEQTGQLAKILAAADGTVELLVERRGRLQAVTIDGISKLAGQPPASDG